MTQGVRPSQFVLRYGPGAILEGDKGPRIIPAPDIGIFTKHSELDPWNYKIDDLRMSKGLLDGSSIFRLPTNAELSHQSDQHLYRTKAFPLWKLCLNQNKHGGPYILYHGNHCPICKDAFRVSQQEAIRFVMACPEGHLDEIPWGRVVHKTDNCTEDHLGGIDAGLRNADSYLWHTRGGTLSDITVECPRCKRSEKLGRAYNRPWRCTGRHPHEEPLFNSSPSRSNRCKSDAHIIQRQAANLRLSEVITLLSLQPTSLTLQNLLQGAPRSALQIYQSAAGRIEAIEQVQKILKISLDNDEITPEIYEGICSFPVSEINRVLKNMGKDNVPHTYGGLLLEEFRALMGASGIGPSLDMPGDTRPQEHFEVERRPGEEPFDTHGGRKLWVTPIKTLRTVTVQKGFRREIHTKNSEDERPKPVDVSFMKNNRKWYPGVEFLGEGLFIMFADNEGWTESISGRHADEWFKGRGTAHVYDKKYAFRSPEQSLDELHPGFVWWHTLSHLLIRYISEDTGYSSASIRERIYFEQKNDSFRGGILLYATQPGNEGTLGGMISLASSFKRIFESSLEHLSPCSGDPLCAEQEYTVGAYNGAACYSCLMGSETSCEHRNMWLDRNLLLDNRP